MLSMYPLCTVGTRLGDLPRFLVWYCHPKGIPSVIARDVRCRQSLDSTSAKLDKERMSISHQGVDVEGNRMADLTRMFYVRLPFTPLFEW